VDTKVSEEKTTYIFSIEVHRLYRELAWMVVSQIHNKRRGHCPVTTDRKDRHGI
jgi:hypothetical protein